MYFSFLTWFQCCPLMKIKTNCGCWSLLRTIIVVIHQSSIAIFSFREWQKRTWLFDFSLTVFLYGKKVTTLLLLPGFVPDYIANCWINIKNPNPNKYLLLYHTCQFCRWIQRCTNRLLLVEWKEICGLTDCKEIVENFTNYR